ncbi:hypothetical protein PISMIDRAFT_684693 [Pisolithus microcarpus 441]|uniref:Uncharacterized protein n=1 Tax=Pisolithus microcarpus 441 TaxID=765257 RepID=A0A0C9YV88_9AGAM|nr:hypothetical protein PISMIDRAFT_684693 [Pisolithus microcarpus 441]
MKRPQDSYTFTVGKLDAGMAILIGERAHLIEFPSVLLPPGSTTGSIVNIAVHQNLSEERKRDQYFWQLQHDILETFGCSSPEPPRLEVRNVTQTSVTLEWPPLKLATAKIRSLDIYKNSQRVAAIPTPLTNTSTKLSGLSLDTPYTFQLVLRTSAGTFHSNIVNVRTHTIADTSGISVCFGTVADPVLLEDAKSALRDMKAKWSDKIQIDTTHFVCTTPAMTPSGAKASGGSVAGGPGIEYQKALQLSIPVVQPQWILACLTEKKMVPIVAYYLGVTPPNAASYYSQRTQSMSQASLPSSASAGSASKPAPNRSSMPVPSRSTGTNGTSPPSNPQRKSIEPTPEDPEGETEEASSENAPASTATRQSKRSASITESRHRSNGTMDRNFKFPPSQQQPPQRVASPPSLPSSPPPVPKQQQQPHPQKPGEGGEDMPPVNIITPSSVEVPPPPPVEKESRRPVIVDEEDEEVGETVEIDL